MAKKSKQMRAALEKIDSTKAYSVEEAVALAKETNFAKFDATVEVAYNLNIDVKKGWSWFFYALGSAVFASLTSILGKVGPVRHFPLRKSEEHDPHENPAVGHHRF